MLKLELLYVEVKKLWNHLQLFLSLKHTWLIQKVGVYLLMQLKQCVKISYPQIRGYKTMILIPYCMVVRNNSGTFTLYKHGFFSDFFRRTSYFP